MRRLGTVAVFLVVGVVIGVGGALVADRPAEAPASTTVPLEASTPPATTLPAPTVTTTPAPPQPDVLLAWIAGGLPSGFADGVRAVPQVEDLTVVRGNLLGLVGTEGPGGQVVDQVRDGWKIPLDVLAVDPATFGRFVDRPVRRLLADMGEGEAVLGETSAGLRGIGVGGRLLLDSGQALTVSGIVPDQSVAGAEVVVSVATGATIGVTTDRYLLVHHRGPRAPFDDAVRALAAEPVRTRSGGETPFLRHADAVLPQALIKAQFGEFSYRSDGTGAITVDPAWLEENIVEEELPVLGPLTCHRNLLPALRGAIDDLVAANLSHLVASFEGCFNPRTIAGSAQLSRHAWGAAVDVNFSVNPTGTSTMQDPRLVDIFERWGFGSGDVWLVPDSGHFEYISPPSPGVTG